MEWFEPGIFSAPLRSEYTSLSGLYTSIFFLSLLTISPFPQLLRSVPNNAASMALSTSLINYNFIDI